MPRTPTATACIGGAIALCVLIERAIGLDSGDVLPEGLAVLVGTLVGHRLARMIEPAIKADNARQALSRSAERASG